MANKLARICYATLRDKAAFDENSRLSKKMNRQAFAFELIDHHGQPGYSHTARRR